MINSIVSSVSGYLPEPFKTTLDLGVGFLLGKNTDDQPISRSLEQLFVDSIEELHLTYEARIGMRENIDNYKRELLNYIDHPEKGINPSTKILLTTWVQKIMDNPTCHQYLLDHKVEILKSNEEKHYNLISAGIANMSGKLDELVLLVKRLIDNLNNDILIKNKQSRKEPEILYHYASLRNFFNIINTGAFWATDNDCSSEIGYKSFLNIFNKLIEGEMTGETKGILNRLKLKIDEYRQFDIFSSSFSEVGDASSKWTTYANFSQGVCFGIDLEKHKQIITKENNVGSLEMFSGFINYDIEDFNNTISAKMIRLFEEFNRSECTCEEFANTKIFNDYCIDILRDILLLESPGRRDDYEYRFYYLQNKNCNNKIIRYVDPSFSHTRYVTLNFNENLIPINKIAIGSKCFDKELTRGIIIKELEKQGYDLSKLTISY